MFYKAKYALTEKTQAQLNALQREWAAEHEGYYGKPHGIRRSSRINAFFGYRYTSSESGKYYNFRWYTSGGNLTRVSVNQKDNTVTLTLSGRRCGLRKLEHIFGGLNPIEILKYDSQRTDASPFDAFIAPRRAMEPVQHGGWSRLKKTRWLLAHAQQKAVKLWRLSDSALNEIFGEYFNGGAKCKS